MERGHRHEEGKMRDKAFRVKDRLGREVSVGDVVRWRLPGTARKIERQVTAFGTDSSETYIECGEGIQLLGCEVEVVV